MKFNFNSIVDTVRELHAHADNKMYLKIVDKLQSEIFNHPEKETVEFSIPANFNLLIDLNVACKDLDVEHHTAKEDDDKLTIVIEYTKSFSRNKIWGDAELLDWKQDEAEEDNVITEEKKSCKQDEEQPLIDGDDLDLGDLK